MPWKQHLFHNGAERALQSGTSTRPSATGRVRFRQLAVSSWSEFTFTNRFGPRHELKEIRILFIPPEMQRFLIP